MSGKRRPEVVYCKNHPDRLAMARRSVCVECDREYKRDQMAKLRKAKLEAKKEAGWAPQKQQKVSGGYIKEYIKNLYYEKSIITQECLKPSMTKIS